MGAPEVRVSGSLGQDGASGKWRQNFSPDRPRAAGEIDELFDGEGDGWRCAIGQPHLVRSPVVTDWMEIWEQTVVLFGYQDLATNTHGPNPDDQSHGNRPPGGPLE